MIKSKSEVVFTSLFSFCVGGGERYCHFSPSDVILSEREA